MALQSQSGNKPKCAFCNSTDFYIEAGYYFCSKCQTQNEDDIEKVFDFQYDPTTNIRKINIKTAKTQKSDIIGWTSWELYNFVLIGLTNELIEVGADPKIKLTILQLWATYLSKLEVAFISKTKKCVPKMARRYYKKDAEIIYGKIQQKKKRKGKTASSKSSVSSSGLVSDGSISTREINKHKKLLVETEYNKYLTQTSSDTDAVSSLNQSLYSLKSSISQSSNNAIRVRFNKKAKLEAKKIKRMSNKVPRAKRKSYRTNHVTTQYASGPEVITPLKLWSIIYLALRIHNQNIYLSDMLRFSREGHLSYYKLDHLLPAEISLTKCDVNLLSQSVDITHKGLRRTVASIAKFLNVSDFAKPNFLSLIKRYCEDLELSRGIALYAERMFLSAPPIMDFTFKSALFPNYEGRAMAYIIVVLKVLFGLDGITEKQISRVIDKINRQAEEREVLTAKLFSFCEWQNFIECRKSILSDLHFSSKLKYDPERIGTSHLYLRSMGLMKSKREGEPPDLTNHKHVISQQLQNAMYQSIDKLNDNSMPMKEMEVFLPSLTPLRTDLTQLLENSHLVLPNILRTKFHESKVGYMTIPDSLVDLASQCGIGLEIVNHNLQYLEKIVPPFEQPKMPSAKEFSELCDIKTPSLDKKLITNKSENLLDYSHRNRLCKLKVNFENFKNYCSIRNKTIELEESLDLEEDSGFDQILPDGRLAIYEDSDSDNETTLYQSKIEESNEENENWTDNSCLLNKDFSKMYNIKLYDHEAKSLSEGKCIVKKKYICRDEFGKFMKYSERNVRLTNRRLKEKNFRNSKGNSSIASTEDETSFSSYSKKTDSRNTSQQSSSEDEVVELPIDCFDSDLDISILKESIVRDDINSEPITSEEILFRPYKNYWMYHCNFSRVKGKNFELFEKELPENFLWLLNECADIVEMTTEDLYEEVCLIEAYHLNILKTKKSKGDDQYDLHDCSSKLYKNNILNKW